LKNFKKKGIFLKRICVFCGSSPGAGDEYVRAARDLARVLTAKNICLVYGGGRVGMMGELASAMRDRGGEIIGVIPRDLAEKGVGFMELSDMRVVGSMHERKALMTELSDGFIALPGGLGTIEEFFEALTWAQLGIHRKPCGLLNVSGYYDRLISFLDHAVNQQFIESGSREMIMVDENPESLLEKFSTYQPPMVNKAEWALALKKKNDAPSIEKESGRV
jgi:uncharacterized protein (TIGR00730 family)